jgi:hypothetical protein
MIVNCYDIISFLSDLSTFSFLMSATGIFWSEEIELSGPNGIILEALRRMVPLYGDSKMVRFLSLILPYFLAV